MKTWIKRTLMASLAPQCCSAAWTLRRAGSVRRWV